MNRGQFDRQVTFQRGTAVADDYTSQGTTTWADLENAWARVRFGTAQEKREASQEVGTQSATFEVIPTNALLAVSLKDRIIFDGSEWDITEAAPLERNLMRFTAARSR